MPEHPGEGMTASRDTGLPPTYITLETCTHNRIHTSFPPGRNQSAPGRTTVKTVRPRYAAGAPS
jgi:hypothetical protein